MPSDPILLDISRLVWRRWAGRLPTGIDRVCLAYCDHFGSRALAVLQWRGHLRVLSARQSARLFALVARDGPGFRSRFVAMLPGIWAARAGRTTPGQIYLNVGHTGLDDPALPRWIAARGARAVFLIHDLIPITHPRFCRAGEAARHTLRMRHALIAAHGIIGNSAATLRDLDAFAQSEGLPSPAQLPAWICGPTAPAGIKPAQPGRDWFITVGTIEGRKNHLLLLQTWQALAQIMGAATPLLVIVGQRGWEAQATHAMLDHDPQIRAHVIEHGRADDAMLATLITGARALLMPSFAEGFGLPVIEALDLGTPVIASDLPVFREITGTIPTYLDPADAPGWLATIQAFCGPCPERERQLCAIAGYRAPVWPDHFAAVEAWLADLP
ncbi:glycosyltransferase family 4 protein [Novosphingobium sp.]|uniref:glycosyltransferase family 4 protein n=1 Tax=Novosphingobium sp. TaxID=1874826 RepID=UPI003B51E1B3